VRGWAGADWYWVWVLWRKTLGVSPPGTQILNGFQPRCYFKNMARIRYTGANGEEPPLTELEQEKLQGQRITNRISETRLKRLRGDVLEKREVVFVISNAMVILRQALMRLPALVVRAQELRDLTHEQRHAIRMSLDKAIRTALGEASEALGKAGNPREAIAEIVGEAQPSQKDIDAMAMKKARTNARRRELRR
jgi:hypothetical protein